MKIILAPDKFKGTLSAHRFCELATQFFNLRFPQLEVVSLPLADGGDGTKQVLAPFFGNQYRDIQVADPLFRHINTDFLFSNKTKSAFIEMADASGLVLLQPHERDCMNTSSYGTGQMIKHAIELGAETIYVGIGGSATNDGGMGMAEALGYQFLDKHGVKLTPIGENLTLIDAIIIPESKLWNKVRLQVACDVDNPFYGHSGAAYVYGTQKGATPTTLPHLDKGLKNLALIIEQTLGIDVQQIKGSGAAGGLGGGMVAFLGAELLSGIQMVKELVDFDYQIQGTSLIITGEGHLDNQTLSGKTVNGVLTSALKAQIPVIALCGKCSLNEKQIKEMGFLEVYQLAENHSVDYAMAHTERLLLEKLETLVTHFPSYFTELG